MKTRAYKKDIGKYYSMMYMEEDDTHYYRCRDGRRLDYMRTETNKQDGYVRTIDVTRHKVMKNNENWEELKCESHSNIQSEQGIIALTLNH